MPSEKVKSNAGICPYYVQFQRRSDYRLSPIPAEFAFSDAHVAANKCHRRRKRDHNFPCNLDEKKALLVDGAKTVPGCIAWFGQLTRPYDAAFAVPPARQESPRADGTRAGVEGLLRVPEQRLCALRLVIRRAGIGEQPIGA